MFNNSIEVLVLTAIPETALYRLPYRKPKREAAQPVNCIPSLPFN
jgi:hypothetical protein